MVEMLTHRGPDGYGYHIQNSIGLGHARLSIIDLKTGGQPIHNENKTVWVVFNGEIFNYIELRKALEKDGHRFYTQTDTEVIVHLYEQYADDFVQHLNGQFAIALWDDTKKRLVLARDRVGIRPLFYSVVSGKLLFASEIKSLFAYPGMARKMNIQALAEAFTFWSPLAPATVFDDVLSVPPGHCLTIEHGKIRIARYWDWEFHRHAPAGAETAETSAKELLDFLIDSVRLQLRADVPVGAYLSGGLDSSIIVSIIKNYTDTPLRTFSIAFEDAEFDESSFQHELVKQLGTHHTELRCTKAAICDAFPRVIWHTETPILRTAPTPLMLLSAAVRAEGYKVVLTGEGADEVFGGYDIFKEGKIRRFWARFPQSTMRPRLFERLYPYLKHSPTANRQFTQNFFGQGMELKDQPYFTFLPRWSTTRRIWQFFDRDILAHLKDWDPYANFVKTLPVEFNRWSPVGRDQYIEAHVLMSGYLLCSQGDRMAMANSVEGRFPFLDHRLIEFANRLPDRYKIMGLREKYLLKEAAINLVPESIRARVKQPYRAPDSHSFFKEGKPADYVHELFSERRIRESGYFNAVTVGKLYEKCRTGRAIGFGDNMAFVAILSTMLVDEMLIRNRPMPQPG